MAASTHSFNFAGPHHKQRHAAGGEDEITPADIGAVAEDDPRIGDAGALLEAATTAAVNANYAASTATAAAERAESAEAAAFAEPDEAVAAMVENTTSDTRGAIDGLIDAAAPDLSGYPSREEVADGYVAAADVDEDVSTLLGVEHSQTRQVLDQRLAAEYPSKGEVAATYLARADAPTVHTGTFTLEIVNDFRVTGTYSFPEGLFAPDGHTPVVAVTPETQFYSASAVNVSHGGVTITVRRIRDDNIRSYTVPVQVVAVQAPDLDPADPQQAETLAARLADLRVEVDKLAATGGNHATRIGELETSAAPLAAIENLSARAVTLPAGVLATAEVTGPTTGKVINLGLPRGADGPPGRDGVGAQEGAELVSQAEAAATAAQNAHTVSEAAQAAAEASAQSASTAAVDAAAIAAPQAAQEAADSIRDNLAADISTPGNPAYEALVDVAGTLSDPQTAGLIGDLDSETRAALDTLLESVAVDDADVAGLVAATDSSTRAALDTLLEGVEVDLSDYPTKTEVASGSDEVDAGVSALIGNPASETAASVRAREQWVNPLDYGAVGDGSTDCTAAIQAALTTAASEGRPVRVPAGVYAVHDALAVQTALIGDGATIKAAGAASRILNMQAGGRAEGLTLDGNGLISGEVVRFTGDGCTLTDCTVTDSHVANSGLYANTALDGITVERCALTGLRNAVRVVGGLTNLTLRDVKITQWQERGVWITGEGAESCDGVTLERVSVTDMTPGGSSRYPIRSEGPTANFKNFTIRDCYVQGPGTYYHDPTNPGTADQISITRCTGLLLEGNTTIDGGDAGMTVSIQCSDVRIVGNRFLRSDSCGIYVGSSTTTWVRGYAITGNTFIDCGQNRGGTINDHGRTGIRVMNAQNVAVEGNVFGNSAGSTAQLYGVSALDSTGVTIGANQDASLGEAMVYDQSGNSDVLRVGAYLPDATLSGVSYATGVDAGSSIEGWRQAGFVTLSLRFRATSDDSPLSLLAAPLPSGWRPPGSLYGVAAHSPESAYRVLLSPFGGLTVYGAPKAGFHHAQFTYPAT